jgi:glutaredoxin
MALAPPDLAVRIFKKRRVVSFNTFEGGIKMAIKLHRCSNEWLKINAHPCWKVQKALNEQDIPYELVKGPLRTSKRDELERLSGQRKYPVIEFTDGRIYREESKDMAARIRAGKLFDAAGEAEPGPCGAPS